MKQRLLPLFLLILPCLLFYKVGDFGFLDYDDPHHLWENPVVLASGFGETIRLAFSEVGILNLWTPLSQLSFALEANFFGLEQASSYHWINLLLHSINGLLLFQFLKLKKVSLISSFLLAALWVVHPLRIESFAWISGRKELLCGVFFLLSLLSLEKFRANKDRTFFLAALLAFLLCCLSKPTAIGLPVIGLLFFLPESPHQWDLKKLLSSAKPLLPFCLISALTAATTLFFHSDGGLADSLSPLSERLLFLPYSFAHSFVSFVFPWQHQEFFTTRESVASLWWLGFVGSGALLGSFVWMYRKFPIPPTSLIGLAIAILTWLPISGLVDIGPYFIADRYTYLPHLGLAIAIAPLLDRLQQRQLAYLTSAAFIVIFSVSAIFRLGTWRDEMTFFSREVAINPENLISRIHLGNALLKQGQTNEAKSHYLAALQLDPDSGLALTNYGLFHEFTGDETTAIQLYFKAIQEKLHYPTAFRRLAALLSKRGNETEAEKALKAGLLAFPDSSFLWSDLAYHQWRTLGDLDLVSATFTQALKLNPRNADATKGLMMIRSSQSGIKGPPIIATLTTTKRRFL